jgi:hypothetical protein
MDRREFLAGLAGPYSLIVLADQLPAASAAAPPADEIRRQFDRLAPPAGRRRRSTAEPHMSVVDLSADFVVAGGGLAGVCAAIAAARHGPKVIVVQDRSVLGGNSSREVKMHVCGSHAIPGWRETGLVEELRIEDAVTNPQRSFDLWDLMLYDRVVSEPNITLLLDTTVHGATVKNGAIQEIAARCDRSELLYRIRGKLFCDATGDCRLGLEAGAEMRTGREAKSEFNESYAFEKADGETLGSSILFTSRLHRKPMPYKAPAWARKIGKEHLVHRRITEWDYGYWWIAWGGDRDIIRDHERIRFELLSIVLGVWDYIKNSGDFPDSANWALDWVAMLPGKRASRRMVGDHILTQHDIARGDIEDAVAIGGWPLDDHPPGGFDRSDIRPNRAVRLELPFNIPLRSLYSRNVGNLFMAGRNISCSHVAFTSTRVMATCGTVGQAVGAAAAMCLAGGVAPRQLAASKEKVAALQQKLLRDDQTIMRRVNQDPLDLARKARVRASAAESQAPAASILDGHLRDHFAAKSRQNHMWRARMTPGGAWIELEWDQPQTIGSVQIAFDTGLDRRLMLSGSDSVTRGQIRAPQPETVRDYTISYNGGPIVSVKGNYERLRRHKFDAVKASSLRIQVEATNGDDFARIFEVRCYAPGV